MGGAVASWIVRSTSERALWIRALVRGIVLCSWARHFTLTVPLSTQVYKWVPANLMHYDFTTDKVCNSLRIQVLVNTCAMSTWITKGNRQHFVDRKPVSIARAECTVDRKRIGASRNSWLQSWSSRRRRNLASLHCRRRKQWSVIDHFVWQLECRVESPHMWSTWDQKSNGTRSRKKEKRPSTLNHSESGKLFRVKR